jgi:hypothetical protein
MRIVCKNGFDIPLAAAILHQSVLFHRQALEALAINPVRSFL